MQIKETYINSERRGISVNSDHGNCIGIFEDRATRSALFKCILITLLILIGVRVKAVSLVALLVGCLLLLTEHKTENRTLFILFLYPFAEVFKYSKDSTSLFTIMMLFQFILYLFKTKGKLHVTPIIAVFTLYAVARLFLDDVASAIILPLGFYYMYYVIYDIKTSTSKSILIRNMVMFFSIGLISASIVGAGMEYVPGLSEVLQYKTTKLVDASRVLRFSGLVTSPASYSLDVSTAISCIISLFYYKKIRMIFYPTVVLLFTFGFMTGSKSFLVSCAVILLVFIMVAYRKSISYGFSITVLALTLGLIIFYTLDEATRYQLFLRFSTDLESGNIGTITTGRFDIAIEYIKYIATHFKTMIIGDGMVLNVLGGRGSHNAYIELVYSFGLIGTVLYCLSLRDITKADRSNKVKRRLIDFLPLINLAVRLFAINYIFRDGAYYLYLLVWCTLNINVYIRSETNANTVNEGISKQ